MKTRSITVNKTAEQPEGIALDIVEPENPLEEGVMGYLLSGFLAHAAKAGGLAVPLPEQFTVEYKGEGSFVVFSTPQATSTADPATGYYSPARPLAVVGIRATGRQFDFVYRDLRQPAAAPPAAPSPGADAPPSVAAENQGQPPGKEEPEQEDKV